jgi:glycosyltransferase involved in cell wall biosynthesis
VSKKRSVAIVRGPNLNSWEMQGFVPLLSDFELVGFTSYGHNFDISGLPFPVRKLFSVQQLLRARFLWGTLVRAWGGQYDLVDLRRSLGGFEIVHTAETIYYCTYQAARAKQRSGFKLVVTVWENIPFLYESKAVARSKRVIFDSADLFLPVSNKSREALILEGAAPEKIRILSPGLDTEHFHPADKDFRLLKKFGCGLEDRIVLFVGNLSREKGIFDLVFAFRLLLDRLGEAFPVKLLFAGKGRDADKLVSTIRRLHLESRTRLVGSYSYEQMPSIHNLADVFVLASIPTPTWQEQFGYVLAESMACGKAVVSTTSGSIPEVVADAGLLVPPNDFVSLASAIERLLTDDTQRAELGRRGRSQATARFDARNVALQLKAHYKSLL